MHGDMHHSALDPPPCCAQAGCRIAELAAALREAGLTLPNYASIREQAVGGFIQVCPRATQCDGIGIFDTYVSRCMRAISLVDRDVLGCQYIGCQNLYERDPVTLLICVRGGHSAVSRQRTSRCYRLRN